VAITLDYTDLEFEDDRAVMLALETDFQFDYLYAQIDFRVDAADFSIAHEHVTLLDFSATLCWCVDQLAQDLLARYPGLDETSGARPYFAPDA
jgi:hypothetical protein